MTTRADRLLPDPLWQRLQPLLPPHPPTPAAARPAPQRDHVLAALQ